jgi:hypothetical protein
LNTYKYSVVNIEELRTFSHLVQSLRDALTWNDYYKSTSQRTSAIHLQKTQGLGDGSVKTVEKESQAASASDNLMSTNRT